ncbi:5-dehydro-2-deoxygluconokinase [Enterovibrio nigricans]|uniref:5-dehydro-2-deoxygluconokinase n=1 Tax=Enterovibrio nigricans DSM 22720 TaxID=1121868 RepID=A0A1T4UV98_9GAMM|nr:5-dehydro-2-deoxygluconokinase [Enterovibrio nigricans]PKF50000.1 5-dehydro-2-deoxygluconokinase [Enterovibrio nigricans]SKA56341.1 5-dehydro-2-deoxygluconokinase [Enterovibrio nigricans DSM 22720]
MTDSIHLSDWHSNANRPLDVICLGRAGVDFYGNTGGADFIHESGFKKCVGGSSGNVAVGLATLGARVGFISCLSDDAHGNYVRHYMTDKGINLDGVFTLSGEYRTSLAIAELRPEPDVVIYRNNAADLALNTGHINGDYLASARCLFVTGTALSKSPSREATLHAMQTAQLAGTLVVLDLDYRPYSWASSDDPPHFYKLAASFSDVVIGNREEFEVMGVPFDVKENHINAASELLSRNTELVVVKAGSEGCDVFGLDMNNNLVSLSQAIFKVDARKPYGAGDAFAAALLFGLLNHQCLEDAVAMGAANAAINVMGDTCSDAMSELGPLQTFMQQRGYQVAGRNPPISRNE